MTALLWIHMIHDLKEIYHLDHVPFELLVRISKMDKSLVPNFLKNMTEEYS